MGKSIHLSSTPRRCEAPWLSTWSEPRQETLAASNVLYTTWKSEGVPEDWRGAGTVLIADDEEAVLTVSKRILESMGFSVLTARDGREALSVFGEHADEIVCVLLDQTMPHLDGAQTFSGLRRLRPGVRIPPIGSDATTSGFDPLIGSRLHPAHTPHP